MSPPAKGSLAAHSSNLWNNSYIDQRSSRDEQLNENTPVDASEGVAKETLAAAYSSLLQPIW